MAPLLFMRFTTRGGLWKKIPGNAVRASSSSGAGPLDAHSPALVATQQSVAKVDVCKDVRKSADKLLLSDLKGLFLLSSLSFL